MTLTIYSLKNCDTCRKAVKALTAKGHSLHVVDVRQDGVPDDKLAAWISDQGWKTVLNTRSTTWRGLPDNDKTDITDAKAQALISVHPTLMKRPVIETDEQVWIGWGPDVQVAF